MTRSKVTAGQILAMLREQEAGTKTAKACRRHRSAAGKHLIQ